MGKKMKQQKFALVAMALVSLAASACSNNKVETLGENLKTPGMEGVIGDANAHYTVLSRATVLKKAAANQLALVGTARATKKLEALADGREAAAIPGAAAAAAADPAPAPANQMLVGLPLGLINENYV